MANEGSCRGIILAKYSMREELLASFWSDGLS